MKLLALAAALLLAQENPPGDKPDKKKKGEPAPFADVEISKDVEKVAAKDLRALGDEKKRYFLIEPRKDRPPAGGYALLVVMPGGTGEASFHNFVRRAWMNAVPDDWVVAQMVCVMWRPDQKTIWPTRLDKVPGQQFTTEEYFAAVVEDVQKTQKYKVDPARVFQMGWSSGGPAAYAIALQEKRLVTGSYVAQSVFFESQLAAPLKFAPGQAFFLDHSPTDETCRFSMAKLAQEKLTKSGATVELVTYKGGHGWSDEPYLRMKKGFEWLEKNHGKAPGTKKDAVPDPEKK
jgi:predicted esterase